MAKLPSEYIRWGNIVVESKTSKEQASYMYLLDRFEIEYALQSKVIEGLEDEVAAEGGEPL